MALNDSVDDDLFTPHDTTSIKIEVTGHIKRSYTLNIEVKFYDMHDTPLAFYSPGHEHGGTERYPSGPFHMEWPKMMSGDYYLYLYLTDPNIEGWVDIPSAVRLVAEGALTQTGLTFDYYKDQKGWLFLRDMPMAAMIFLFTSLFSITLI